MRKIIEPEGEAELTVIKSLLEGEGIPFFVQNDIAGSAYQGGLPSDPIWGKAVYVSDSDELRALSLVQVLRQVPVSSEEKPSPGIRSRLLAILRLIAGG